VVASNSITTTYGCGSLTTVVVIFFTKIN
jgi:hypothetical protein